MDSNTARLLTAHPLHQEHQPGASSSQKVHTHFHKEVESTGVREAGESGRAQEYPGSTGFS